MKGKLLVFAQFILLGVLALTPNQGQRSLVFDFVAVLLLGLAITILLKSFRDLGEALTPLPESKEGASLVTTGIYEHVRHPIYSALFILSAGIIVWKQSLPTIMVSLILSGLLIYKSRYEDSLLLKKFPEAVNYQEMTPAFIPNFKKGKRK